MSRNYNRQKTTITLKVKGRKVANIESPNVSSSEGGYSALENLSDSDDEDEEDVQAAESEQLKQEMRRNPRFRRVHSPRPTQVLDEDDDEDDDDGDDLDDEDDSDADNEADAEEDDEDDDDDDEDDDAALDDGESWNGIETEKDDSNAENAAALEFAAIHRQATQTVRHVRFNVPDSSDSDSTDTDTDHCDMFPDLFVEASALDPVTRRAYDREPEGGSDSDGSGSYWDFNGADYITPESDQEAMMTSTPTNTPVISQMASEVSTPTQALDQTAELDGYETDGDTTEDDIPEAPIRRKVHRRDSDAHDADVSDSDKTPVKSSRGKPRVGRFNLDKSDVKPIVVLDPKTKKMLIFTPKSSQLDLSPEQFGRHFMYQMAATSPVTASATGFLMNTTMFANNTFGDFMNTVNAPTTPTGSTPLTSLLNLGLDSDYNIDDIASFMDTPIGPPGPLDVLQGLGLDNVELDSDALVGDEAEMQLDIGAFIKGNLSDTEDDFLSEGQTPQASAAASDTDGVPQLSSPNPGLFRLNQTKQQLMLRNNISQDAIDLSAAYNDTALRGLKSDRVAVANEPLTPARRRRKSSTSMQPPSSPLESIVQKRKASSEHDVAHKRHRSISDMAMLQV